MWSLIESGLHTRFRQHPQIRENLEPVSRAVAAGQMTPTVAAQQLLGYLYGNEEQQ